MSHASHTYYKTTILPQKCNAPDVIKHYYPKKSKPNKHSTSKSVYSHALAVVLFHLILLIRNMSSLLERRTTFLS